MLINFSLLKKCIILLYCYKKIKWKKTKIINM